MPELPELNDILHSGALGYGKWGKLFESKLRNYIGVDRLMITSSYAAAIQIALSSLNLKPGDEVITSPMSCLASNMPLKTFGLTVVWADIDPSTGTLLPESVKEKITSNTKLIFHNQFCGYMGYIDEINEIGKEYGIPVIDDCVEAFGSKYKGNYSGNLNTDISIFSFQTVRLPNTIDGGAIVFNNEKLYNAALLIRDFGINRSAFRDENNEISAQCDIAIPGYGATMSEVNSYIGCKQIDDIDLLLNKQKVNAKQWDAYFDEKFHNVYSLSKKEVEPNYWVYGFLTDKKYDMMQFFRNRGYYASGVHLNNNVYSVFNNKVCLHGVSEFTNRFLAIPCGWWFDNNVGMKSFSE